MRKNWRYEQEFFCPKKKITMKKWFFWDNTFAFIAGTSIIVFVFAVLGVGAYLHFYAPPRTINSQRFYEYADTFVEQVHDYRVIDIDNIVAQAEAKGYELTGADGYSKLISTGRTVMNDKYSVLSFKLTEEGKKKRAEYFEKKKKLDNLEQEIESLKSSAEHR